MILEISEEQINDGARKTHLAMEDGARYSFEQVKSAFIACLPGMMEGFLANPEGVTGDYPECRPAEFNEVLGITSPAR